MSFATACAAIMRCDIPALEQEMINNPDVFWERRAGAPQDTLLHVAACWADPNVNALILYHLKIHNRLASCSSLLDDNGDSPLHLAARWNSPEVMEEHLDIVDPPVIRSVMKWCNNKGKMPLFLLYERGYYEDTRVLHELLLPYTLDCTIKPLNAVLSPAEVLEEYSKIDQRTAENMKAACKAVNEVRRSILKSNTHPEFNFYTPSEKASLTRRIRSMRDTVEKELTRDKTISAHTAGTTRHLIAKQHKVGNCHEYSVAAADHLRRNTNKRVEVYSIEGDDHVFVVLDRAENSDPSDHRTWGPHAVVCDPWSGLVYRADQIPFKLKTYYPIQYPARYNIVAHLNLQFHKLVPIYSRPALAEHRPLAAKPVSKSYTALKAQQTLFASKKAAVTKSSVTPVKSKASVKPPSSLPRSASLPKKPSLFAKSKTALPRARPLGTPVTLTCSIKY